jgi:uncharacterized protein YfbU (UPF0304 family)
MSLSDVDRRILLNQYKILSALYPGDAAHYDRLAEILAEGYYDEWSDIVLVDLKKPLPREDTDFVLSILTLYDWMQRSYYSLSLYERRGIDDKILRFPGFDANAEARLATYARFLVQRMERFTFLNTALGMTAEAPRCAIYARMLAAAPVPEERGLTAQELRAIFDAAAWRPAPAPAPAPRMNRTVAPPPSVNGGTRGALARRPREPEPVLPTEVFAQTPELAAFEAALNASLAREAFPYLRE